MGCTKWRGACALALHVTRETTVTCTGTSYGYDYHNIMNAQTLHLERSERAHSVAIEFGRAERAQQLLNRQIRHLGKRVIAVL